MVFSLSFFVFPFVLFVSGVNCKGHKEPKLKATKGFVVCALEIKSNVFFVGYHIRLLFVILW